MNSALFTYNRTEKVNNVEVVNANYINPMHILSMYWSVNENNARILNVFTSAVVTDEKGGSKTMRLTFGERTGERLVEHTEAFLSLMVQPNMVQPAPQRQHEKRGPRNYSNVLDPDAEIMGEAIEEVRWEGSPQS